MAGVNSGETRVVQSLALGLRQAFARLLLEHLLAENRITSTARAPNQLDRSVIALIMAGVSQAAELIETSFQTVQKSLAP
jgi:hypothetical protein